MNKTAKIILAAVLAVVLVGGGVFVGINWNSWFGDQPAAETGTPTPGRKIQIPLIFPALT